MLNSKLFENPEYEKLQLNLNVYLRHSNMRMNTSAHIVVSKAVWS